MTSVVGTVEDAGVGSEFTGSGGSAGGADVGQQVAESRGDGGPSLNSGMKEGDEGQQRQDGEGVSAVKEVAEEILTSSGSAEEVEQGEGTSETGGGVIETRQTCTVVRGRELC